MFTKLIVNKFISIIYVSQIIMLYILNFYVLYFNYISIKLKEIILTMSLPLYRNKI